MWLAFLSLFYPTYAINYLSIFYPTHPTTYPSIHLSYSSNHLSIYPSSILLLQPSIHLSIFYPTHPTIYPSIHLSLFYLTHPTIYPSIPLLSYSSNHLSIYYLSFPLILPPISPILTPSLNTPLRLSIPYSYNPVISFSFLFIFYPPSYNPPSYIPLILSI